MRKQLLIVTMAIAIALPSCGAGLKNQIKGKWEKTSEASKEVCIEEYLDALVKTDCTLGTERLFTITSSYEVIEGDRVVFTSSKGVKEIIEVKIEGNEMQQKLNNGILVKLKRIN
jgi:hypothetical protein